MGKFMAGHGGGQRQHPGRATGIVVGAGRGGIRPGRVIDAVEMRDHQHGAAPVLSAILGVASRLGGDHVQAGAAANGDAGGGAGQAKRLEPALRPCGGGAEIGAGRMPRAVGHKMRHRRLECRAGDTGDGRRDLGGGKAGQLAPGMLAEDRDIFRQRPDDKGRAAAVAQLARRRAVEFHDQIAALAGQNAGVWIGALKAGPGLHHQMQVGFANVLPRAGPFKPPGQRVPFPVCRANENLIA